MSNEKMKQDLTEMARRYLTQERNDAVMVPKKLSITVVEKKEQQVTDAPAQASQPPQTPQASQASQPPQAPHAPQAVEQDEDENELILDGGDDDIESEPEEISSGSESEDAASPPEATAECAPACALACTRDMTSATSEPCLTQLTELLSKDKLVVMTEADVARLADQITEAVCKRVSDMLESTKSAQEPNKRTMPLLSAKKQLEIIQTRREKPHEAVATPASSPPKVSTLVLGAKPIASHVATTDTKSEASKLTDLLKTYKNKSQTVTAIAPSAQQHALEPIGANSYNFSHVYIINLTDHGDELSRQLAQCGLKNKVIRTKSSRKNASVLDFLPEVVSEAQKRNAESVLVLLDTCAPHIRLAQELALQTQQLKTLDWKLLYMGAAQNLIKNDQFDWTYYKETYPELAEHGVTSEPLYARHWKYYGQKEGRFGTRSMDQPHLMKSISAVAVHQTAFEEIAKYAGKTQQLVVSLTKHIKQKSYAMSPLLFLTDVGRNSKTRSKHNLALYGLK